MIIENAPADSADAIALIAELDADIARRYPGAAVHGLTPEELHDPRIAFLIARIDGRPAGCGALRPRGSGVGEVKRMYVRPDFRGRGVARAVLRGLEGEAARRGFNRILIETGTGQPEAIALYQSAGFVPIAPYSEYAGSTVSRCFEKRLDQAPAGVD